MGQLLVQAVGPPADQPAHTLSEAAAAAVPRGVWEDGLEAAAVTLAHANMRRSAYMSSARLSCPLRLYSLAASWNFPW